MLARLLTKPETPLCEAIRLIDKAIWEAHRRKFDRRYDRNQTKRTLEFLQLHRKHLLEREAVGAAIKQAFYEGFGCAQPTEREDALWRAEADAVWPHTQAKSDTEELDIIRPSKKQVPS